MANDNISGPLSIDDGLRITAQLGDRVKLTRHSLAGEGEVGFEGRVLAGVIVADGQNPKSTVRTQAIVSEIERPAVVGGEDWLPEGTTPQGPLADMEACRAINSLDALVVVVEAFRRASTMSQRWPKRRCSRFVDQPAPQRFVGSTSRLVVLELAIDADPAANGPFCRIELLT